MEITRLLTPRGTCRSCFTVPFLSSAPLALAVIFCLLFIPTCPAAWFDAAWQYRRPVDVTWDAEKASGSELATLEFYSDGHALPDASDVRIATDDGRLVPSRLLMSGPGDRIRMLFSLRKGIKKYAVYFGNPSPQPPPKTDSELKVEAGLLIESKVWTGGSVGNFDQIEKSWQRSGPPIGAAMIPRPFLGYNLFGDQQQWISKVTGSLFAPAEGPYKFAMTVDRQAALFLDGKPVLFAHQGPADIRYNATFPLTRGRHEFLLYHVAESAEGRFTVGWKRPDTANIEVIGRETFGTCFGSQPGVMEEHDKPFIADFSVAQAAECYCAERYSFRYHFAAKAKAGLAIKYDWDFGDGQTSTQPELDHVYLADGIYPVRLTAHVGPNSNSQTSRIVVQRDYEKLLNPVEDQPAALSKIIQEYDLNTMPASVLPRAIMLHLKSGQLDSAVAAAQKLAGEKALPDPGAAGAALMELDHQLIDHVRVDSAISIWDRAPVDSPLQPRAVKMAVQLAMWWTGDFDKALHSLAPFKDRPDPSVQRLYGQALILGGQVEEGKKILLNLAPQGPADREAALSGASARSVEFFITEGDAESGEEAWDRWQAKYPADFVEGYSILLRTKLIELRKRPQAAAKVAEAFALAMPQSSYAPQLIDRASKLLAKSDSTKSSQLRQLLKQKYPEDPLSQD